MTIFLIIAGYLVMMFATSVVATRVLWAEDVKKWGPQAEQCDATFFGILAGVFWPATIALSVLVGLVCSFAWGVTRLARPDEVRRYDRDRVDLRERTGE